MIDFVETTINDDIRNRKRQTNSAKFKPNKNTNERIKTTKRKQKQTKTNKQTNNK